MRTVYVPTPAIPPPTAPMFAETPGTSQMSASKDYEVGFAVGVERGKAESRAAEGERLAAIGPTRYDYQPANTIAWYDRIRAWWDELYRSGASRDTILKGIREWSVRARCPCGVGRDWCMLPVGEEAGKRWVCSCCGADASVQLAWTGRRYAGLWDWQEEARLPLHLQQHIHDRLGTRADFDAHVTAALEVEAVAGRPLARRALAAALASR